MVMAGVMAFGTLRFAGIELELGKHGAGRDDVTGVAGQLEHFARYRRWHIHDGFGGFHRNQRRIEGNAVARLDQPFDDGGIGQAFTEVGEEEGFGFAHGGGSDDVGARGDKIANLM